MTILPYVVPEFALDLYIKKLVSNLNSEAASFHESPLIDFDVFYSKKKHVTESMHDEDGVPTERIFTISGGFSPGLEDEANLGFYHFIPSDDEVRHELAHGYHYFNNHDYKTFSSISEMTLRMIEPDHIDALVYSLEEQNQSGQNFFEKAIVSIMSTRVVGEYIANNFAQQFASNKNHNGFNVTNALGYSEILKKPLLLDPQDVDYSDIVSLVSKLKKSASDAYSMGFILGLCLPGFSQEGNSKLAVKLSRLSKDDQTGVHYTFHLIHSQDSPSFLRDQYMRHFRSHPLHLAEMLVENGNKLNAELSEVIGNWDVTGKPSSEVEKEIQFVSD